jgi:DNA modification methylase
MCGDSTDAETVAVLMDGQKADMVFTDPPYNVNYADKNKFLNQADKGNCNQKEIENDNHDTDEEIGRKIWLPAFTNLYNFAADNCSIYVTMPQGGTHMMMMMMIHESGWQVKHELIWVKNNHVLGRTDYFYKHEPILFGWKKKHVFYGKGEFNKSVWEIDKPHKSDLHPTMKPIKLIENALMNSSDARGIIADLFGGSGSTLIACEQLTRKCYMMELDPKYCDVIVRRWESLTGKKAEKVTPCQNQQAGRESLPL